MGGKMTRLVGVDVSNDIITITLDYRASKEDEVINLVKKKMGEEIKLEELSEIVPEIRDLIDME